MMIDRATELRRLAHLLHQDESALSYLDSLDGAGLQKLRSIVQNSLIDEFAPLFSKLAASGKFAPDSLSAFLAQKVFGATLAANIGYYTPTDKVVKMARLFDLAFLTDVARAQVPERAKEMLKAIPVDVMQGVTRNLLDSHDYHIMGDFTDHLPEDKVAALMNVIRDPADHLRVSSFAQRKDRIARLTAAFNDDMLKELIVVAFSHEAFLREICLVMAAMSAEDQQRMASLTDAVNPAYRQRAGAFAKSAGLNEELDAYFT